MCVFIKDQFGSSFPVELPRASTIKDLKFKIKVLKGLRVKHQHLIFGGAVLKNGRTLSDYNIANKATVVLVLKLAAAAAKRRRTAAQNEEQDDDGTDCEDGGDENALAAASKNKDATLARLKKMFKDQLTLVKADMLPGDEYLNAVLDTAETLLGDVVAKTGDAFCMTMVKLNSKQLEELQAVPALLVKNRNPDYAARLLAKHLFVDSMTKLDQKKTTVAQIQKLLHTLVWLMFNAKYGCNSSMYRAFETDINQAIRDKAREDALASSAESASSAAAAPARGGLRRWFP